MKISCPFHAEDTASLEIYEDHYYCFGCRRHGVLEELGLEVPKEVKPKVKEDLELKRKYIDALPKSFFRGLELPYDSKGYYICWPDSLYYTCRAHDTEGGGPKYRHPSGHETPIFWVRRRAFPVLYVVEGQINAISLGQAIEDADICSPGSATAFLSKSMEKELTEYANYSNLVLVVDKDAAGAQAVVGLYPKILKYCPFVSIVLMDRDCNEILVHEGKEKLREEVLKGHL